jgi:hypothetical protein
MSPPLASALSQDRLEGYVSQLSTPQQISARLKEGSVYAPADLSNVAGLDEWYRIPNWLAGKWRQETLTTTSEYDCVTKKRTDTPLSISALTEDREGWQSDSRGDKWNYQHTPFVSNCDSASCRQIFFTYSVKPLEVNENRVVKIFKGTGVLVDKTTNIIKQVTSAECIESYVPIDDSTMICRSCITEFDISGKPLNQRMTYSIYNKIAAFKPSSSDKGRDVKLSFCNYLQAHGLTHLIPNQLTLGNASNAEESIEGERLAEYVSGQ